MHSNLNSTAGLAYSCVTNPGTITNGCITADPEFVNPAAGNYRLAITPVRSPCIDAGTNLLSWMTSGVDMDGNPRILGKGVDMGAYESVVTPAGTTLLVW